MYMNFISTSYIVTIQLFVRVFHEFVLTWCVHVDLINIEEAHFGCCNTANRFQGLF